MKTITFGSDLISKKAILQLFSKSVDDEGFVIELKTGARVVTPNNEEVHVDKLGAIRPGSEVFVTNDLPSLLEHADFIGA